MIPLTILVLAARFTTTPAIVEEENAIASFDLCADREEYIHCTCMAEKWIQCLVWGDVPQEYWKHFQSHPHATHLKFNVKPTANLTYLPRQAFGALGELETLEVSQASIDDVPSHSFANMSALAEVNLGNNKIASMASRAFAHLPSLTSLILDFNRLSELRRGVFVDVPRLEKLYLTKNRLSIVHDKAFEDLHNLIELQLDSNEIHVVAKDTFVGLMRLKNLDLSFNKIDMLGDATFSHMIMLEALLLESNHIQLISEEAFVGLGNLRKLVLKDNKITTLPPMLFDAVPNLYYLDLESNFLETLTEETVSPIMHNLINSTSRSHLLVDINQFICDCRLWWTRRLYNETAEAQIKEQLPNILCRFDETEAADDLDDSTETPVGKSSEASPDAPDSDDDYLFYDESNPQKTGPRRFLQIPTSELSCSPDEEEEMRGQVDVSTSKASSFNSILQSTLVVTLVHLCVASV